jgi:hypothetical protein
MNMEEAFPNLNFVGEGAEQFKKIELTVDQLMHVAKARELGRKSGEQLRTIFGMDCNVAK